ncbi:MAG: hypothetical protein V7L29_00755 [Nostoc sp.]|uniref:hypothetical protein n=1 Tax=Nostoc sp. TaxID=1180 RepID=UPI002FF4AE28
MFSDKPLCVYAPSGDGFGGRSPLAGALHHRVTSPQENRIQHTIAILLTMSLLELICKLK